jgi:hypothetical protein
MRIDSPGGCKAIRSSACVAHRAAFAHSSVVRAFSAMELSDSRAAVLVDCAVFCRGHSARGRDAADAWAAEKRGLGIVHHLYRLRADDCNLPLWRKVDQEQAGIDGSGCGQGDSLFVVSPGEKTLLIDGGGAFSGFPGHEERNGVHPGKQVEREILSENTAETMRSDVLKIGHHSSKNLKDWRMRACLS